MSSRIIRSTEPNKNSETALASSVLPVPVGPASRNTPIGLFGIVQAGLEHGDPCDHGLDRFVLADYARSKEIADRLEVELLPGVEHRDRQAGELR